MARTTEAQRAARRREVAKRLRLGESYAEIADTLDVSKSTVGRDVERLRQQWRADVEKDMSEHMAERLAELRAIKREAYAAWLDSREGPVKKKERTKEGGGDPDEFVKEVVRRAGGNPGHLRVMLRAESKIQKLLGVHDFDPEGGSDRLDSLVDAIEATAEQTDWEQFEDEEIR